MEFDYLDSCDVIAIILEIAKFNKGGLNYFLMVGNERNLRVWKVRKKGATKDIVEGGYSREYDCVWVKECKNVHSYILNSLSKQYLLSSDYLKINRWKPKKIDSCFTLSLILR